MKYLIEEGCGLQYSQHFLLMILDYWKDQGWLVDMEGKVTNNIHIKTGGMAFQGTLEV